MQRLAFLFLFTWAFILLLSITDAAECMIGTENLYSDDNSTMDMEQCSSSWCATSAYFTRWPNGTRRTGVITFMCGADIDYNQPVRGNCPTITRGKAGCVNYGGGDERVCCIYGAASIPSGLPSLLLLLLASGPLLLLRRLL